MSRIGWLGQQVWLGAMRRYIVVSAVAHLVWEVVQLPLYTLWRTGTRGEQAFAVLHCTGGDLLIAGSALLMALIVVGDQRWPDASNLQVAALTVAIGIAYTIYSEWLNTTVRLSWTYTELMPVVPWTGTGLSPLLQWVVVPALALRAASRRATEVSAPAVSSSEPPSP